MPAHQLIVGGQRSGKSRHAERLALRWAARPGQRVAVIATAEAHDDEMRARIARHRAERPAGFDTVEAPLALCDALRAHAAPERLLVVDCLTLWLTNWLMPMHGAPRLDDWRAECASLQRLLPQLSSPVVFVSNEVGWGVMPMGREVRAYVDELGRLNQLVARQCAELTLMVAGQPWTRPVDPMDTSDAPARDKRFLPDDPATESEENDE
ncbi:bifunctional adenosylcobinamide kinase/adenosylcobinamide-phosphate guanylyltransferase [Roseateles chitosanitabidus]|uniref:bifunctional adenosylcobinamide kinase/adenosylcobinamide-phosphate guanylyltransferase n=1 Tax=Roseateles chitosanitabidus TaxID=65048 RepID=UPI000A01123E|nr:bifunctional adenosylcobinamide kinase/adenosylcobinamide-phosphate guanylyltransferase [Roseateles chitosanitabidus]MBO9686088.1 bifunctional adenosylcobinamide kinase/adenosylcobinamide-phosphate guanylyltransferase [Roseateles chitosanitabidus]